MDAQRDREIRQRFGLGEAPVADDATDLTEAQQFRLTKLRELNQRYRLGLSYDEMVLRAREGRIDGLE